MSHQDTIVALATPSGVGAIAVIRISGPEAIARAAIVFKSISGKDLTKQKTHTIHLGHIIDGEKVLDKVLVSIFRAPNSYTGEDVVEVSCHGSPYIQQQIIQLFLRNGCRTASAGEFTLRAFLNGKMDLSQAEAVADLIASDSEASHEIAMQQMRGGFSNEINRLRDELLNFASLLELELDFSEEDVEFVDREKFEGLLAEISKVLKNLIDSFALGNVIKNGIPVAIVGEPNVGKSTLLNTLLKEERAIVSDIPGTTRDTIEDQLAIGGINFRFIDTAGIRETVDVVEGIGIQRTLQKIEQAKVVLYMLDAEKAKNWKSFDEIDGLLEKFPKKSFVLVVNKADKLSENEKSKLISLLPKNSGAKVHLLSAQRGDGVDDLKKMLLNLVNTGALGGNDTIVTNNRHYSALLKALEEIQKVRAGMQQELSGDLLAIDVRQALFHLGEITGEVTTDDLLGNIFSNFCIGK
ncbi:tRNA uridine-5-carboxymethylaminomethyl(34) synthesis GTPase MnmE [Flagellimonas lutaonensis]|uniref:tRNA modification GTPase MnmE n=1 Tax=Flagellimonas lutaonensis TaxID=516051 RepID=A0A0D5YW25_9FLAO|nr:tRNA uridine-5-carboxymethylaminomethyl(34) synthesis GTPase MnmE [Allomuricauda lutaonensis]AKA36111.1 tRNA modification GTPase MnmE [Allomuricauda lutaonensis]